MSNIPSDLPTNAEPSTVRDKIVQAVEELTESKAEQRQVKTELDEQTHARLDAESQANHLHRQIQIAEVNLDSNTSKVDHVTTQLVDVLKVSEAAKQYALIFLNFSIWKEVSLVRSICTDLDNKLTTITDKEIGLDDELRKAKASNVEIDRRVQEVIERILFSTESMISI